MKKAMEKVSVLSLSLILVSTFAVTPVIPQMIAHFQKQGIAASQVELLATVSSFAILTSLLLNNVYSRFLSERQIIISGLLLVSLGGSAPVLISSYAGIFISRLLLGFGLGMINARAINIISHFYHHRERVQMLGLRGSAEVLGSASLTALVGFLLGYGWQAPFLIYLSGLLILALYVTFVPRLDSSEAVVERQPRDSRMTPNYWKMVLSLALIAFFTVNVNSAITLRIPQIVTANQLGTASQASLVLSAMQLMGILAGMTFSALLGKVKQSLLPLSLLIFASTFLIILLAPNLFILALAGLVEVFFNSVILTIVFNTVAEKAPVSLLNTMTTVILLGCNLGGGLSSVIPNILDSLNPTVTGAFGIYAATGIVMGLIILVVNRKKQL